MGKGHHRAEKPPSESVLLGAGALWSNPCSHSGSLSPGRVLLPLSLEKLGSHIGRGPGRSPVESGSGQFLMGLRGSMGTGGSSMEGCLEEVMRSLTPRRGERCKEELAEIGAACGGMKKTCPQGVPVAGGCRGGLGPADLELVEEVGTSWCPGLSLASWQRWGAGWARLPSVPR